MRPLYKKETACSEPLVPDPSLFVPSGPSRSRTVKGKIADGILHDPVHLSERSLLITVQQRPVEICFQVIQRLDPKFLCIYGPQVYPGCLEAVVHQRQQDIAGQDRQLMKKEKGFLCRVLRRLRVFQLVEDAAQTLQFRISTITISIPAPPSRFPMLCWRSTAPTSPENLVHHAVFGAGCSRKV